MKSKRAVPRPSSLEDGAARLGERFGWEELYRLVQSRKEERPRGSGTTRLLSEGVEGIARRLGDDTVATVLAAQRGEPGIFVGRVADLVYRLTVLMAVVGVTPDQVVELLRERHEVLEKRRREAVERQGARSGTSKGTKAKTGSKKPKPKTKAAAAGSPRTSPSRSR